MTLRNFNLEFAPVIDCLSHLDNSNGGCTWVHRRSVLFKSYAEKETNISKYITSSLGFILLQASLEALFYEVHFHESGHSVLVDRYFPLHGFRDQTDPVVFLVA